MRDWHRYIGDALARASQRVDDDVIEELAQHASAAYASARAEGCEPEDALRAVDRLIAAWVADAPRLSRRRRTPPAVAPPPAGSRAFAGVWHDVRYAVRLALRNPVPSLIAALTLALGIGASSTLFSVAWGVLMKPLPWAEPDTLIRLKESREGATRAYPWTFTNHAYLAWADAPATIEALAAYAPSTLTLTGFGEPQRVKVTAATASLFSVLRAVPLHGALFSAEDEAAPAVTVVSHGFWQRQLGGRPDAVGDTLTLDGRPHTIVGILPRGFSFPDAETIALVPYRVGPSRSPDGGSRIQMFSGIARLKPGVTPAQAAEEATARARHAPDPGLAIVAVFGSKGPSLVEAERLLQAVTRDVRDAIWVLLGAVCLLLLTATANIASVQLARAASRQRELSIRVALGAGSGRLARQLVFESLAIGVAGGTAGVLFAAVLHAALPAVLPADFPRVSEITMDARVVLFALLVTILASVTCGLVPAVQAMRLSPRGGMSQDTAATGVSFTRTRTARVRAAIMVGQLAVACLLLVAASLLGRTFIAMLHADRGYEATNVLTARLATPDGLFTPQRRAEVTTRILERLRGQPAVLAAGSTNVLPLMGADMMMALHLPAIGGAEARTVHTGFRVVSPGYLESLGMRVVSGRTFGSGDTRTAVPALVVNRAFVRRYLSDAPVGTRLALSLYDETRDWEIIGVVDNVRMRGALDEEPGAEMFVSYQQVPGGLASPPVLVARTRTEPQQVMESLRQIVAAEAPAAALESMMTMEQRVMSSLARPRLYAVVLLGFAAFALAIAGVGLFGVLSYAVAQRSKELGVRMALGAQRRQLVGMVVRECLTISAIGIALGLWTAALVANSLAAFLYGVAPVDAVSFALVALVLLVISLAACALPAYRAASVDPLTVLRA